MSPRIESLSVGGQVLVSETAAAPALGRLEVKQRLEASVKGLRGVLHVLDVVGLAGDPPLRLAAPPESWGDLQAPVECTLPRLDGKRVDDRSLFGAIRAVSSVGARVELCEPGLRLLDDVRLVVPSADLDADLYAKVTEVGDSEVLLRFTSVPPMGREWLSGLLAHLEPTDKK